MSLPKSRSLNINGQKYRWLVKGTHIPEHNDQRESSLTIQRVSDNLIIQFRVGHGAAVTPSYVRSLIEEALPSAWRKT